MANARMISRDFFTSADLEDLPATGRILFAGMVVYADDAGVIRHHPSFFRYTLLHRLKVGPKEIQTYLDHLQAKSVISSILLQGVSCWKITNFSHFQRLKRREGKRREEKRREDEGESDTLAVPGSVGEDPEERRVQVEGGYEQDRRLLDEIQKFARCGQSKARELYERLREPKRETLAAWTVYDSEHGTVAAVGAMQGHSHPSEVRAEKPRKSPQSLEQNRIREAFAKEIAKESQPK